MAVTREQVLKIAELARLQFGAAELDAFVAQFQSILDYIEKLKEVDIDGVEPTSHAAGADERSLFREDTPRPSLPSAEALRNAPDQSHDHFRVPAVMK
jgi:aspartyl-tRNA(Asn)/glutamyl-tRNA(Gln) amidotransferase subunit C